VRTVEDPRTVAELFRPERPGPLMHAHLVATGVGTCRADAAGRAAHVELPGGNHALRGDPGAVGPADLEGLRGLVEAPPEWLPVLRGVDAGVAPWARIVAVLPSGAPVPSSGDAVVPDAAALRALHPECGWIHDTWGGADALAAAGVARAVVVEGRAVAVAAPFFVGEEHEDVGVVTDPAFRGRGLSTACAAALVGDIRGRGRVPTWTTSPPNAASRAVAARLGFRPEREDVLHAVGVPVPD
jgi:GNAT superfamily N-acetyltransferase